MHATIVFLSALVAVAAGQSYWHGGYMPFNHALGVPMDTPEVYHAKVVHAHAHAAATARSAILYRKRREAPAAEVSAPEDAAPDAQPTKRQLGWGLAGYGAPWAYPTAYSSYYSYPLIYRKKRDTAAVSSEEESISSVAAAEKPRDKKHVSFFGYYGGWGPTAYAATWHTHPHYLYRKRRDVSAESSHEEDAAAAAAAPSDATTKDKRQIILGSAAWGYPSYPTTYLRTGLYNPWGLGYLYRKRRDVSAEDTDSQVAPEETPSIDSKQKRQLLLGYPYTPYVMPYYGARLSPWW